MKPIHFLSHLGVAALCAAAALPVVAQAPPPKAGAATGAIPGLPGADGGAPTATVHPPGPRTFSCEIPVCQLEDGLEMITKASEAKGIEMPNTLFAPNTAKMKVPSLKLRSVTPSGALSLLAAAASCDVEQVVTPAGEVAGWMFKQKPPLHSYGSFAPGGAGGIVFSDEAPTGGGLDPNQPAAPAGGGGLGNVPLIGRLFTRGLTSGGATSPALEPEDAPATLAPGAAAPGPNPGTGFVVGMGGGAPPQALVTRVYAIGLLLDEAKPEAGKRFMDTLQELLAVDGSDKKPQTPPSLSFHDGAKLLVVKACPEAQALIDQTLQAMTQNARDLKTVRQPLDVFRQRKTETQRKDEEKTNGAVGAPPAPQPINQR